ncbi:hypothetical protein Tco_1430135 [Tanacetum coccineum]
MLHQQRISTKCDFDIKNPFSYTTIKTPIRRLVHRLITLSVSRRFSGREKVTIADLFYLHNMDEGMLVDVPWKVARYFELMSGNALNAVTRGHDTTLYDIVKSEDLGIIRLRVMNDRLGEIDQSIYGLADEVEKLTQVVLSMFEQYDQFYREFGQMRLEQQMYQSWSADRMSQLLSHHLLTHDRYDRTQYVYVPNIPDLGVQQSTHGQSNTTSNAPYWPIPTRNATLDDEEAQGKMGFALNLLTKLTQVSHHTDCHAGNPCELVNDPRVKICDPIIEEIQGPLLAGACNNHGV